MSVIVLIARYMSFHQLVNQSINIFRVDAYLWDMAADWLEQVIHGGRLVRASG